MRNDRLDAMGTAPQSLEAEGLQLTILDAFNDKAQWPTVDAIAGLVVFGGGMNADETARYPYLLRVRELIRECLSLGTPTLGVCLGAQLLARASGALVYRAPVRELGFVPVYLTSEGSKDPVMSALDSGVRMFQWHEDTFDLPEQATLLAKGKGVHAQAYRIGRSAWGMQFHIEADAREIETWLAAAGPKLQRVWGRSADSIRAEMSKHLAAQLKASTELFRRFAQQVVQDAAEP